MNRLATRATAIAEQARQREQQKLDQRDSTLYTKATTEAPAATPIRSAWWAVHQWEGCPSKSVFTDPPATYAEMRSLYPNAAGIIPAEK